MRLQLFLLALLLACNLPLRAAKLCGCQTVIESMSVSTNKSKCGTPEFFAGSPPVYKVYRDRQNKYTQSTSESDSGVNSGSGTYWNILTNFNYTYSHIYNRTLTHKWHTSITTTNCDEVDWFEGATSGSDSDEQTGGFYRHWNPNCPSTVDVEYTYMKTSSTHSENVVSNSSGFFWVGTANSSAEGHYVTFMPNDCVGPVWSNTNITSTSADYTTNDVIFSWHPEYGTSTINQPNHQQATYTDAATTITWDDELSSEYTNAMLRDQMNAIMPSYGTNWNPGGDSAFFTLDAPQWNGSGGKMKYRFRYRAEKDVGVIIHYLRITYGPDGNLQGWEPKEERVTGQGENQWSYTGEHEEPVPTSPSTVAIQFSYAETDDDSSPDDGGGAGQGYAGSGSYDGGSAGSAVPSGGTMGAFSSAGGCSSCAANATSAGMLVPSSAGMRGMNYRLNQKWNVSGGQSSLYFRVSLGAKPGGGEAGFLYVNSTTPDTSLFSPYALKVMANIPMQLSYNTNGMLTNVVSTNCMAKIAWIGTNFMGYSIEFYTRGSNAALISTWTVQDPRASNGDPFRLRITETPAGGTSRIMEYAYQNLSTLTERAAKWTLSAPDSLYQQTDSSRIYTDGTSFFVESRQALTDTNYTEATYVLRRYQRFPWGQGLIYEERGDTAHTTSWTYSTDPRHSANGNPVLNEVNGNGNWLAYDYDDQGRVTQERAGTADCAVNSGPLLRSISYDYNAITNTGDIDLTANPRVMDLTPRTVVEALAYTAVRRTLHVYTATNHLEIQTPTDSAVWNLSSNLTTLSSYYSSGVNAGRLWKTVTPDGLSTIYTYQDATNSGIRTRTETVATGVAGGVGTNIQTGTMYVNITGHWKESKERSTWNIASGTTNLLIARDLYSAYDAQQRYTTVTHLDGTKEFRSFACCGLDTSTDREGVVTQYLYDSARRPLGYSRLGITMTNVLDPAGRPLATVRVGSDSSVMTLRGFSWNTAGELRYETNALGGVTIHTPSWLADGRRRLTDTPPEGGSRVQTYGREGALMQVTGAGAVATRWERYAASYDLAGTGAYENAETVREVRLDATGADTGEETTTYTDMLGHVRMIQYGSGSVYRRLFYNLAGQLAREVDPDGVVTLYSYNTLGELEITALDINPSNTTRDSAGNYSIDLANDRIQKVQRTVTSVTDGTSFTSQHVETREFPNTADSTNTVLVSVQDGATDALRTLGISYGLTNRTTQAINTTNQTRTVTNLAPDGSYVISAYASGRLGTVTRYASGGTQIGKLTYAYDAHGRLRTTTDARNGTTTYGYNAADQVNSVTTPPPGNGQAAQITSTLYDTSLRAYQVTAPDGAVTTREFYQGGQLKKTYGSRQYPVEYTYDAQGRMLTMKTWQNFAGNSGTATTTWHYNSRGALDQKIYPDTYETDYTYTDGGRLKTRYTGRGVTTTYNYDFEDGAATRKIGDLASVEYSDGTTPKVKHTYDRRGRRTAAEQRDASNNLIASLSLGLDSAGRLQTETQASGPLTNWNANFAYDSLGRRSSLIVKQGTTAQMTNGYAYDAASRLASVTNGPEIAAYTYLTNSPLAGTVTFTSGGTTRLTTTRTYDYLNRLTGVSSQASASGTAPVSTGYGYNDANQRVRAQLADGSAWVYDYDSLGQVKSGKRYWSDGTPVAGQQYEYAFDDIGNRKSTKVGGDSAGANLRASTYTLAGNGLNQYASRTVSNVLDVLGASVAGATVQAKAAGSYVTATRKGEYFHTPLALPSNTSTPVWQTVVVTNVGTGNAKSGLNYVPKTPEAYTYDGDGNLTQDGHWQYVWDGENRLIEVHTLLDVYGTSLVPAGAERKVTYSYDAYGRLLQRKEFTWNSGTGAFNTSPSVTTSYLSDGWQCVAEIVSGSVARSYLWGSDLSGSRTGAGGVGGLLLVRSSANGAHFAAYDGNGNVTALVKASDGTVSARYEYGPFGEMIRLSGTAIAIENPWRFSTKRNDPITDLVHYEYRVYNQGTGAWLSRDPIEEKGGWNLYGFVGNRPVSLSDALGLAYGNPFPSVVISPFPLTPTRSALPSQDDQSVVAAWFSGFWDGLKQAVTTPEYLKCQAACSLDKQANAFSPIPFLDVNLGSQFYNYDNDQTIISTPDTMVDAGFEGAGLTVDGLEALAVARLEQLTQSKSMERMKELLGRKCSKLGKRHRAAMQKALNEAMSESSKVRKLAKVSLVLNAAEAVYGFWDCYEKNCKKCLETCEP